MDLPPDLLVVCRLLASTKEADLPNLCPVLVHRVLRCGGPLSAPSEPKGKGSASDAANLVQQLKTKINTLLHGKTAQGRFAGMALAKAVIDVGGWECLRTTEPWVRGLLSILQVSRCKPPPSEQRPVLTPS